MNVENIFEKIITEIKNEYLSKNQKYPWIVGFSGGKDSTLLTHAIFNALIDISPSKLTRQVHVVSNDTLVESPLVLSHLKKSLKEIQNASTSLKLPLNIAVTTPNKENTFWILLIGKGYPSPNSQMRWCTDRLKISPTSNYIKNQVSSCGAAIILLGVRSDESEVRKRSILSNPNTEGSLLHPHKRLTNAFIYRPIMHLTTDEVWEILSTNQPPWGGTHRRLINLYREAAGGECPVVLSEEEAPGCGTNSSRFGCWTCTVVDKDKSLQGFIDSGNRQYTPLINFRDWIKSIRNDYSLRQSKRRTGKITVSNSGKLIPGPFTLETRRLILEKLLETEKQFGQKLISEDEIEIIQKIWAKDLLEM